MLRGAKTAGVHGRLSTKSPFHARTYRAVRALQDRYRGMEGLSIRHVPANDKFAILRVAHLSQSGRGSIAARRRDTSRKEVLHATPSAHPRADLHRLA